MSSGSGDRSSMYFERVAQGIVNGLSPRSTLHLGAGGRELAGALQRRNVDAEAMDLDAFMSLSRTGSDRSESGPVRSYELAICLGLFNTVDPSIRPAIVAKLAGRAESVLVGPAADFLDQGWLRAFIENGFERDPVARVEFAAPGAAVFRRASSSRAERGDDCVLHINQLELTQGRLRKELERSRSEAREAQAEVRRLRSTRSFRYTRRLRDVYGHLRRLVRSSPSQGGDTTGLVGQLDDYETWVALYETMDERRRADLGFQLRALPDVPPLISILMPVYDPPEEFLIRAIESVRRQLYPNWELCLVDDASTSSWVVPLLRRYCEEDARISLIEREVNGHVSVASNDAMGMARGVWITCLDHDDELPDHALASAVLALAEAPATGLLYSDEDKIDSDGRRHGPYFKPDFDPLLLLGQNYPCHMTMWRADLVRKVGGFRAGYEGSQDWDLTLRVTELLDPSRVMHVPHILYHWRVHLASTAFSQAAKPYAAEAGTRAVSDHLARTGQPAEVIRDEVTGWHRVRWPVPDPAPRVSIMVPTRDGAYLDRCISQLVKLTSYPDYELIVMDNGSQTAETAQILRGYGSLVRVIRDEAPFNFSSLNNRATREASGTILCLLNDDCEVTDGRWLGEMVSQLCRPRVGVVGAKLVYPDGHLQHGGIVLGIRGAGGHVYRHCERSFIGNYGSLQLARRVSAVTGACMTVRREVWEEMGGLDEENLAWSFNDLDFCLRVQQAGWAVVWTPFAELTHFESASRGLDVRGDGAGAWTELEFVRAQWGPELKVDSAYNPNLTLADESGGLAWPPRVML